ncbi:hypothetical protein OBBRIDRAFT_796865 [Obba rivulosa]|uniref:Uncharacterized protein n=1 Tax=Obba rivulosa TaxID=1052685 RepID=A0A8E2AU62_9APHY|nr:hypothetical protein OBBRIDRAFT_796865 [Obba rivulosa]
MSVPNQDARGGALPSEPPVRKTATLVSFSSSPASTLAPPPMAAASSSRPSRPVRAPSDVFKPRFPLDPFASAHPGLSEPWFVQVDNLLSLAASAQLRRHVVLVLGGAYSVSTSFGVVGAGGSVSSACRIEPWDTCFGLHDLGRHRRGGWPSWLLRSALG